MNNEKKKVNSLSARVSEFLKLLDPKTRCEIEANNQRKNYNFMETAFLEEKLSELFKKKFLPGRKNEKLDQDSENCQALGTLKELGVDRIDSLIGIITNESDETVRRRRIIYQAIKSDPRKYENLAEKLDDGSTSIEYAERMVRKQEYKKRPSPKLPEGEYSMILLDPPWSYDLELSGAPTYKTLTQEELEKVKIPAYKDCILFMWVTNPKLEEGLDLLRHYGFTYKTNIVWIKQKENKLQQTTGFYVRGAHELLLVAIKGKPGTPAEGDRPPSVVFAPRGRHSEKPEVVYEIIESMYPNVGKKLEMFARGKPRNNWTSWGDELEP